MFLLHPKKQNLVVEICSKYGDLNYELNKVARLAGITFEHIVADTYSGIFKEPDDKHYMGLPIECFETVRRNLTKSIDYVACGRNPYFSMLQAFSIFNNRIEKDAIFMFDRWLIANDTFIFPSAEQCAFLEWAKTYNRKYHIVDADYGGKFYAAKLIVIEK